MKKYLVLLLLIPSLSFNLTQNKVDIVGKWTGKDINEIGSITFESNGYARIEVRGRSMGGKLFKLGDKWAEMTYKYYSDKNPKEIDIVISHDEKHPSESVTVTTYQSESIGVTVGSATSSAPPLNVPLSSHK